jgi:hypothetical protein
MRLSLLAETVLEGVVGGGQAVIIHENRMSEPSKNNAPLRAVLDAT